MSASAAAQLAMTHLVPLAKEIDEDKVTPGVLGFIVFAALAVGVWMLMKSMNRHMGRVNFEEAAEPAATSGKAASGKSTTAKGTSADSTSGTGASGTGRKKK